jgi:hypothetical protein
MGKSLPQDRQCERSIGKEISVFHDSNAIRGNYFSICADFWTNKVRKPLKKSWHAVCLKGLILGFGFWPPKF